MSGIGIGCGTWHVASVGGSGRQGTSRTPRQGGGDRGVAAVAAVARRRRVVHPELVFVALAMAALLSVALPLAARAQAIATAPPPSGQPDEDPPHPDDEILSFLRVADIEVTGRTEEGINRPLRARARHRGRVVDVVFRSVDRSQPRYRAPDGRLMFLLRDSYRYEPAAYELSRLLGLGRVPPAILRGVGGRPGSIQLWVHGVVTEGDRLDLGHQPADPGRWQRLLADRRIFDRLIDNVDRNLGNQLVHLESDEVWWIDHTRSFTFDPHVFKLEGVKGCSRSLFQALREGTEEGVRRHMEPFLTRREINALWARWVDLRDHLQELVDRQGADVVLFGESLVPTGL